MIYCEACGDQIKSIDDIAVVLVEANKKLVGRYDLCSQCSAHIEIAKKLISCDAAVN